MSYRYHSRRATKRLARKSRRNFILTIIILAILLYSTITWILPSFIGGLGFIKDVTSQQKAPVKQKENTNLAPPVFNIPYEATNSAQIDIKGFATPNSKVKLYIDDEIKDTAEALPDGSFTFEDVPLGLGTNNIYGKTVDGKGEESLASKTLKIIYDYEKPTLSINEPEDGKNIQGAEKKVKVSGKTEINAKVFINDSQAIVSNDGNFSTEISLNDGDNIITIKSVDATLNTTEIQRKVTYTP